MPPQPATEPGSDQPATLPDHHLDLAETQNLASDHSNGDTISSLNSDQKRRRDIAVNKRRELFQEQEGLKDETQPDKFSSDDYYHDYFRIEAREADTPGSRRHCVSSDTSIATSQDCHTWADYKHFRVVPQAKLSKLLPKGFEYEKAAGRDPNLSRLAVSPNDLGLHRLAKFFLFRVPEPPRTVVRKQKRNNRWGVWYFAQLLSQIRTGAAKPFVAPHCFVEAGIVYDTPRQRSVWKTQGIDWPTDLEGLLPWEGFSKLGAGSERLHTSPERSPSASDEPASYVDGKRISAFTRDGGPRTQSEPLTIISTTSDQSSDTRLRNMAKRKSGAVTAPAKAETPAYVFEPLKVPKTGWGINSDLGGKPGYKDVEIDLEPWTTEDDSLVEPTEKQRADINKKTWPGEVKLYGIWNVSDEQLLDTTWKPIPYQVLDDACMVIVMSLCMTNKQRGQYWPYNFDNSGNPRPTRLRFGPGVICHYGTLDGETYSEDFSSYLIHKRHHIFGGMGSKGLTVLGATTTKDDRVRQANGDPSSWGHGTELVPRTDKTTDDGISSLHLYVYHNLLPDGKYTKGGFETNRWGPWFRRFHQGKEIPLMLDEAVRVADQKKSTTGKVAAVDLTDPATGTRPRRSQRINAEDISDAGDETSTQEYLENLAREGKFNPGQIDMIKDALLSAGKTVPAPPRPRSALQRKPVPAAVSRPPKSAGKGIYELSDDDVVETPTERRARKSKEAAEMGDWEERPPKRPRFAVSPSGKEDEEGFGLLASLKAGERTPFPGWRSGQAGMQSGYAQLPAQFGGPPMGFPSSPSAASQPVDARRMTAQPTSSSRLRTTLSKPKSRVDDRHFDKTGFPASVGYDVPVPSRSRTREELYQDNAELLDWLEDFDNKHPEVEGGEAMEAPVTAALAAWMTPSQGGLSLVEQEQAILDHDIHRDLKQIKTTAMNFKNMVQVLENEQKHLQTEVLSFARRLATQPVYSHLRTAKLAMMTLVESGDVTSARYVADVLKNRIAQEPNLAITIDFDEALPGVRRMLELNVGYFKEPAPVAHTPAAATTTVESATPKTARPNPRPITGKLQSPASGFLSQTFQPDN